MKADCFRTTQGPFMQPLPTDIRSMASSKTIANALLLLNQAIERCQEILSPEFLPKVCAILWNVFQAHAQKYLDDIIDL